MADDDVERRLSQLEHDHRLTRWYTGRVDRDLAEIATVQTEHTERLDRIEATQKEHTATLQQHTELLQAHTGRFDSLDAQMRSLTQLIGQVLDRLPAPEQDGENAG